MGPHCVRSGTPSGLGASVVMHSLRNTQNQCLTIKTQENVCDVIGFAQSKNVGTQDVQYKVFEVTQNIEYLMKEMALCSG